MQRCYSFPVNVLTLCYVVAGAVAGIAEEPKLVPLFNGKDLSNFKSEGAAEFWRIENEVLIGENNPTNSKLTSVYYLYKLGFGSFRMGYASAVAWVLFIAIFAVTIIQFRLSSSNQAYSD